MAVMDFYSEAHLVVAAVRILEHQQGAPPSIEDVCRLLAFSLEEGHLVCRKLEALNILVPVERAFGLRLAVGDHRQIETIPRGESEDKLSAALKEFQSKRADHSQKIEAIKAQQAEKQKTLFADLEKKLKDGLPPKK